MPTPRSSLPVILMWSVVGWMSIPVTLGPRTAPFCRRTWLAPITYTPRPSAFLMSRPFAVTSSLFTTFSPMLKPRSLPFRTRTPTLPST